MVMGILEEGEARAFFSSEGRIFFLLFSLQQKKASCECRISTDELYGFVFFVCLFVFFLCKRRVNCGTVAQGSDYCDA